jgi:hypothetical protein
MDEEIYVGPEQDIMSLRVGMMVHVAESLENIHDVQARDLLISAMKNLLYTVSPPRGEVVEMKH